MIRRVVAVTALSLSGIIGIALPAYAGTWSDDKSTEGAAASCTMRSWTEAGEVPDQHADIDCNLSDTLGDNHSVYVEWWQDGYAKVRLSNRDGVGHTTHHHDSRYNGDGSFGTLNWRVCRDAQFQGDNCSKTVSHEVHR